MKIDIKKRTPYICEYTLTRKDKSVETIKLDTKTYLVHDICHFVVESNLKYSKGFWGMLSKGYSFIKLSGKENPQTTELRFIEQIVGPVQSLYMGHIPKQDFSEHIRHLNFTMTEDVLSACLTEIKTIIEYWQQLEIEQKMTLEWKL